MNIQDLRVSVVTCCDILLEKDSMVSLYSGYVLNKESKNIQLTRQLLCVDKKGVNMFDVSKFFTPENLRKLADELEQEKAEAESELAKIQFGVSS